MAAETQSETSSRNGRAWLPRRRMLLLILLGALALRLALVYHVSPHPERYIQADAVGYERLAVNLASGHGFSMRESAPFVPDNSRTPGYPAFLAATYLVFGHHPPAVLVLQAILGALTCLLAYGLGSSIGGHGAGLVAAILLALSPHSISYSAVLWSETLFTLFLTGAVWLSLEAYRRGRLLITALAGLALGLATLVHVRSLFLVFLFCVLLFLGHLAKHRLAQGIGHVALYAACFGLCLAPWIARNQKIFGVANLSSISGTNLLDYSAALMEASRTGQSQWEIAERYDAEVRAASESPLNEAQFSRLAARLAWRKIQANPAGFARVQLVGATKVLLPGTSTASLLLTGQPSAEMQTAFQALMPGRSGAGGLQAVTGLAAAAWPYVLADLFLLLLVYVLAFYALATRCAYSPEKWVLALISAYLALVAGAAGTPRFRVAIMPFLCVLAACGIALARQGVSIWHGSNRSVRSKDLCGPSL